MPKIVIREVDNTSSAALTIEQNVVYIPGLLNNSSSDTLKPKYYSSKKEFEDDSDGNHSGYDINHLSYKLAEHCFDLGLKVVYQGLNNASALENKSITWDELEYNKNNYPIRFLTAGGFAVTDTSLNASSIYSDMISCAQNRGDCIALVDYIGNSANYSNVSAIRDYFEGVKSGGSSYAAGFVPNFETVGKDFEWTESVDGPDGPIHINHSDIPASSGYLFSYARMLQNNPEWLAVAGSSRGSIPELKSLSYVYSEADVEQLQARATTGAVPLDTDKNPQPTDNIGIAINPITTIRPYGDIIWGNRTLLDNGNDGLKATSFLNVRNLVTTIKKLLYQASKKYTFDQNGDVLWINFSNEIIPTLERMKSGNGILAYRFDRVKTNKKARLAAKLSIVPIEGVEDFEFDIYLENDLNSSLEVSES